MKLGSPKLERPNTAINTPNPTMYEKKTIKIQYAKQNKSFPKYIHEMLLEKCKKQILIDLVF